MFHVQGRGDGLAELLGTIHFFLDYVEYIDRPHETDTTAICDIRLSLKQLITIEVSLLVEIHVISNN